MTTLHDFKIKKKQEMLKIVEQYEEVKYLIGCPQGELRSDSIDCCNCTECLKYAINKSIYNDTNELE